MKEYNVVMEGMKPTGEPVAVHDWRWQYLETRKTTNTGVGAWFIKGTRIQAVGIWCDVYGVAKMTPEEVADDRWLQLEAVREALELCEAYGVNEDMLVAMDDDARKALSDYYLAHVPEK